MNKVINVFSGIILIIFFVLAMGIVYDLSLSSNFSLKGLPYKYQIAYGLTLIIFTLGVLRIVRKWQGAKDMKRFQKFTFVRPISKSARNLALLYATGEILFMSIICFVLLMMAMLDPVLVSPMLLVIFVLMIEGIIFSIRILKGGDAFRVGINKSVVAYFNREMNLIYYTGLKRVELHQDMINFQYPQDLNILLPLEVIEKNDRLAFRDALIETLETELKSKKGKNIYIDDAFRNMK